MYVCMSISCYGNNFYSKTTTFAQVYHNVLEM